MRLKQGALLVGRHGSGNHDRRGRRAAARVYPIESREFDATPPERPQPAWSRKRIVDRERRSERDGAANH
jgi:hypothetical protein